MTVNDFAVARDRYWLLSIGLPPNVQANRRAAGVDQPLAVCRPVRMSAGLGVSPWHIQSPNFNNRAGGEVLREAGIGGHVIQ